MSPHIYLVYHTETFSKARTKKATDVKENLRKFMGAEIVLLTLKPRKYNKYNAYMITSGDVLSGSTIIIK